MSNAVCNINRFARVLLLGLAFGLLASAPAFAASFQLVIQPIQICNDNGTGCANSAKTLFEAEGDKIWAQADIDLVFLPWITQNSTALNTLNMDTELSPFAGTTIQMYFVNTITDCGGPGGGIFGCGYVDTNGLAIADNVFSFNGGTGRLDTIAHELGHNLGLGHGDFGAGATTNLMTSGGTRTIPTTINDIFPDGADLDQLTAAQIAEAKASGLLQPVQTVPEPGTLSLIGLGALAAIRRRRSKA